MAVRGVINEFFNLPEFQKQLDAVTDGIAKYIDLVKTTPVIRAGMADSSDLKQTIDGMKQLGEHNKKVADTTTQVINSQRELDKAVLEGKIQKQEYNKELKAEIQLQNAATGSINEAKAAIVLLTAQRNNLNVKTEEGAKAAAEINRKIDEQNDVIKENVSLLEKQRLNIGNYQGSAKIIVDALERAKAKVESVGKAFGQASPEAQAARKEFESLDRITQNPQFLNIASKVGDSNKELRFFTQQLNSMKEAGLQDTQVFRDIRTRLAGLTDQIGDTRAEIKALSSDTRGFDLFAGSVNFAADAFQTFAGAAALGGKSEEEVANVTKTLIAIQSVSNGVKGIANELTTKGTAANKAYSFVVAQVGIVTNAASTATQRLNAILKLSGIGLLITGITFLISKLNIFGKESGNAEEATKKLTDAIEQQRKAVDNLNSSLDASSKLRIEKIKQDGIRLKQAQSDIDKAINEEEIKTKEQQIRILEAQEERSFKARVSSELQFQKDIKKAKQFSGKNLDETDLDKEAKKALEDRRKALSDENEKDKQALLTARRDLDQIRAQGITKQLEDEKNLTEKQKKDAEEAAKKAKELADQRLKVDFEIGKISLQQQADFNKEIADDDKRSSEERLFALQKFVLTRSSIITQAADVEKQLGTKTAKEKTLIDEQAADELLRLQRDVSAQGQEILSKGVVEKSKITDAEKSHIDAIGQQVLDGFKDRSEKELAIAKDLLDKKKELRDQEKELYKNLYSELEGFAIEFFTSQVDREIAKNQDDEARIDERKQKDIDAINQTLTDRAKAADEIKIIEAKAASDKAILENKNRELERRKQSIERLGKIAEIAGNTAQGVASLSVKAAEARAQAALLAANPLTAAFAPIALANSAIIAGQIPLVIGIGAAQIARLVLPKFKDGGITPGGPVIVGDGGKSEGVKLPDGTILKTPDKSTVVDLPKGSRVFPDFKDLLLNSSVKEIPDVRVTVPFDRTERAIQKMEKSIVRTIKNKQENHWHMPGRYDMAMRDGSRFRAYLNENL